MIYIQKKYITARFNIEGVHHFTEVDKALGLSMASPSRQDVGFLAYPHRHLFGFEVTMEVGHSNRDLEFIQVGRIIKDELLKRYPETRGACYFADRSCEMLAEEVLQIIEKKYPDYSGSTIVAVSEDGENAGTVIADIESNYSE